ncbi:hypothetical protein J7K93_11060 [bacterium]|nr:hypothetical protein [bacterium]
MNDRKRSVDYLYIFIKWRKFIIINALVVAVAAAAVSLVVPRWYTSKSVIMPPQEETQGLGFSNLLNSLPFGSLGLTGLSEGTSRVLAIFDSRTLMESVAQKFDLMILYKEKNMEETIKELRKHVKVNVNEEGTISLAVEASTPFFASSSKDQEARILARDMNTFLIQKLDSLNKVLKAESARNTRIFIEKRYFQNLSDLTKAEQELKTYQEEQGAIALPEQITATIAAVSDIEGQIVAKEVELNVMQKYMGSSHTEIIRLKNEIAALKNKFNDINTGSDGSSVKRDDVFLPLQKLPDLALNYARLYRSVKIQEKIQEFLLPQYEQAKIQEAKNTPTVQVLDRAVIPIKRSKPKRAVFVMFFSFLSCLLSCIYVLFIEYVEQVKNSPAMDFKKEKEIIHIISNDFIGLFNRTKK